jgi:peptide deformylase
MALRDIELLGSDVLREPAREVEDFDGPLVELVEDMFETMYHARGVGLAGPQVGVSSRVLVLHTQEEEDEEPVRLALVNPRVVEVASATAKAPEGCLSIPGLEEVVERPESVTVEGFDPEGRPVRVEATGLFSRVLQHEIDHLDGILFIDRVSPLKRRMLLKKWKKSQEEAAIS